MSEAVDEPGTPSQGKTTDKDKDESYWSLVADSFAFRSLHGSPREVWLMYLLIVLDAFSYFAISFILVLYLSNDFGFTDIEAGWVYGLFGMFISLFSIVFGVTVDIVGVRLTLVLGHVLLVVGRIFMAYTTSRDVLLVMLLLVLPLGAAFLTPTMSTGLRRFTHDNNRSDAFGLYVIMLNLGALLAAPTVDIIRSQYTLNDLSLDGSMNEYRVIICVCWIVSALSVFVVFFVRDIDVGENGEIKDYKVKGEMPTKIMWEIFKSKRFWRFMLFVLLLTGVRFVFRHLDATFPKYMVRNFGDEVPFASILAINPFLVIFLIPAITPATHYLSLFKLILIGTTITALSVAFMLFDSGIWNSVAFIVFFSIGEAIWSPRLFEYCCMVAPKGREGTFMACASAPTFIAKLAVGGISGWLLTDYCPETATPENGECDGFHLWLIVFLMTLSSPVLILLLQPVIAAEGTELRDDNEIDTPTDRDRDHDDEATTSLLNKNNQSSNQNNAVDDYRVVTPRSARTGKKAD